MIGSMEFDDDWTMNPNTGTWGPGDMPMMTLQHLEVVIQDITCQHLLKDV